MGTRTEHAPGTFSWVDLTTSDAAAAREFYGGLFGWELEDSDMPGGGTYTMAKVDGGYVAGIPPDTDVAPPQWNSYVTVAGADETVAKARELGASVIEEPFDVGDAGRMALFLDPTGAALCVWEPRDSIGATRVNDPGCLTWNELHTPDPERALEFYTALFGWNGETVAPSYTIVRVGERSNGSVTDAPPNDPPFWLPYFTVESRDAAIARATERGARELTRLDMPQGSFAALVDPQGAAFAVFEGEIDD